MPVHGFITVNHPCSGIAICGVNDLPTFRSRFVDFEWMKRDNAESCRETSRYDWDVG